MGWREAAGRRHDIRRPEGQTRTVKAGSAYIFKGSISKATLR
jgi:hypothetical protein